MRDTDGSCKWTLAQVLSCEFYEISKSTYFTEHPQVTAPAEAKFDFSNNLFEYLYLSQ